MSFRESSGRETCNRCRKDVELGQPVFVGEISGAFWCEGCAESVLGQSLNGEPCPKVRAVGKASTFDPAEIGASLRRRILARRAGEPIPFDAQLARVGRD